MKEKLKRCPFCGNKKLECDDELSDGGEFAFIAVYCNVQHGGCGAASGYFDSKEKAIKAWNRRTGIMCRIRNAVLRVKKSLSI